MASGNSTTAQFQKQPVFKSDGDAVFRIPALLYVREHETFLAFAEQRKTLDDASAEKLVMKTGTMKEESSKKTIEWSDLKVVEKAQIKRHRPMNPCPVYDKVNKKLFLFFICVEKEVTEWYQIENNDNRTRLCYITSEDVGENWSDVTDLTDKLSVIRNWATFAVGPGHGIQTEGGTLIIPVYAYTNCRSNCLLCCCCKKIKSWFRYPCEPYALSLYFDSYSKKWKFGKVFNEVSVECQMAELSKDHIYCNARNKRGYRVEAVSDDKGDNFNLLTPGNMLVETEPGCQGSVVSFPAQSGNAESDPKPNKWLLYTHPTSQEKRVDLGVYLNKSPRDPKAWSYPCIINGGTSGYSDLAYIDKGWFACLFECGDKKENEKIEQIVSVVFSYEDITKK